MGAFDTEVEAKSFALRLVIHLVGDLHAPLNCIEAFGKDFNAGDQQGRLQLIPNQARLNIHNLKDHFDSVGM